MQKFRIAYICFTVGNQQLEIELPRGLPRNLDKLPTNSIFSNYSVEAMHPTEHSPTQTGTPSASWLAKCIQRVNLQHNNPISFKFQKIIKHPLQITCYSLLHERELTPWKQHTDHTVNLNELTVAHKNTCNLTIPWNKEQFRFCQSSRIHAINQTFIAYG
jgi:hypothetical protein